MSRKLICLLLSFSLILSLSVPVFALELSEPSEIVATFADNTEPIETTPEPSETVPEPTEPPETFPELTEPSETFPELTEPSETFPELTEPSEPSEPSEPLKVDLTENSITAIADAVMMAAADVTQNYITDFDTGKGVFVPSQFLSGGYNVVVLSSGSSRFWVSPDTSYVSLDDMNGYWWIYHTVSGSSSSSDDGIGSSPTAGSSSSSVITVQYTSSTGGRICSNSVSDPVLWSNVNIYDSLGNLIHSADSYNLDATIYFDTGFDDLTLGPQIASSFVLPTLEKAGYRFDGWFLDSSFTLPYSSDVTFAKDTTLYAKWTPYISISFVTGIDGFVLDSVLSISGEAYYIPSFSYDGYEFMGAYTDEGMENQFVDGTIVDSDLTLYLRFQEVSYDVGALLKEQNDRLEVLTYVQMAQSIMLATVVIALYFFRGRKGFGI